MEREREEGGRWEREEERGTDEKSTEDAYAVVYLDVLLLFSLSLSLL